MSSLKECEIVSVLAAVQAAVKAPKNQINKYSNYAYRSLEDILEAAKPITSKLGAAITLSDDVVLIGSRYYVKSTARFLYGDAVIETVAFAREPEEKKGNDAMQITGTASSYARKYAVSSLLCLDDSKDIDSEDNRGNAGPATAPQKAAAKPAATTTPAPAPKAAETAKEVTTPFEVMAALDYVIPNGPHKGRKLRDIYKTDKDAIVTIQGDAAFKGDTDTVAAINTIDNYIRQQKEKTK